MKKYFFLLILLPFSVSASIGVTVSDPNLIVTFPYSTSSLDTYLFHSSYSSSSNPFSTGDTFYSSVVNGGANGHYTVYVSSLLDICNSSTTYSACDLFSFGSFEYWMSSSSVYLTDPSLNATSTSSTSTPDFSTIRPIDIITINSVIVSFILLFWSFVAFYDYRRKK